MRSTNKIAGPLALALFLLAVLTGSPAAAAPCSNAGTSCTVGVTCVQQIPLKPGWNAVYLEVQPDVDSFEPAPPNPGDPPVPGVLLDESGAGLPIESVWTPNPQQSTVDFIRDPTEATLAETGWLGYRPSVTEGAFLTNLYRVIVNRPYLVKVVEAPETPADLCWVVSGRPSLRPTRWVPNSFNLVGMGVDPADPPTFQDFFAASTAHAGQPVFRLTPGETVWKEVVAGCSEPDSCTPDTEMRSGEAFWIDTEGASDYDGPMGLRTDRGDGLDFGQSLQELDILVTNRSSLPSTYTVRMMHGDPGLVSYRKFTNTEVNPAQVTYPRLTSGGLIVPNELVDPSPGPAQPGEETRVRLTVRRNDFGGAPLSTMVAVTDETGSRRLIPLSASVLGAELPGPGGQAASSQLTGMSHAGTDPFHGLWVGRVTLDKVAEVHNANNATNGGPPVPVATPFSFRLIVHVDNAGTARLLKEVIQMWEDGSAGSDGTVDTEDDIDGRLLLVTRDDKIPDFKGVALHDGELVGRRISSAAFDFDESSGDSDDCVGQAGSWDPVSKALEMDGSIELGGALNLCFALASTSTTNPSRHLYHDQHDEESEIYEITRDLSLTFDSADPRPDKDGNSRPEWGETLLSGMYDETLKGLHRKPLMTQGTFELRRVTVVGELN